MNSNAQYPLTFSSDSELVEIARTFGTPILVHNENSYNHYANEMLNIPNAFGHTVRYAMKANSHRSILQIFDRIGLHIDASSYYEVQRALAAGISPEKIMLTSQQVLSAETVKELVCKGVIYCSVSLNQLKICASVQTELKTPLSVRINPGLGSGHNNRTNTAGVSASFGIWHEYLPEVLAVAESYGLKIERVHTHVGSGSDWKVWQKAAALTLDIVRKMPDVKIVNLGGGYKIDRIDPSRSINLHEVFSVIKNDFEKFSKETGRSLYLEVEPGTYLSANSCMLLTKVNDIVNTGKNGYTFIKVDASMTELLRPMIYGAKHPIRLLGKENETRQDYVVVGCCCESGDIFTVKEGDPELIDTVKLPITETGDCIAIMGAGAYGISMSAKNYNSRPVCAEVMIRSDGSVIEISRRQKLEEIWEREVSLY